MPASISPETRAAIVILFLQGIIRDKIAKTLDISQGTVSNELQNLKNTIGEPSFNLLKELGKYLQKNHIQFDDAIVGFHVKSLLKNLGVDVDRITDFVEGFYNACVQNGVAPTVAIKTVKRIIDIEKEAQIPFEELPKKYQNILNQIKAAEETLAALNAEITNTENEKTRKKIEFEEKIKLLTRKHDEMYTKHNTSEKKVNFFTDVFESLKSKKVPIEDTEEFAKMMADAKNLHYSVKSIISQIQASKTHDKVLKKTQDMTQQLQGQIRTEISELKAIKKQKAEALGEVKSLKNQEIVLKRIVQDRKEDVILLTKLSKSQLDEMLQSFLQNITQASSKVSTEFQYLASETKEALEAFIEQEKLDAQNARIQLDESCQKLNEKCEEFGRIKSHTLLIKLIDGTGDPSEILLAMMFVFQRFREFVNKSQFKSKGLLLQILATLIKKTQEEFDELSKNN
jgi:hypothetical protein